MLVIRLRRIGRKNDPHYRLVVAEHTAPVQGKFITEVGHYHPKTKEIQINQDQFLGWIERGAKPSNSVAKLAERSGIVHEHIVIKEYKGKPKKKAQGSLERRVEEASAETEETPSEKPATEGEAAIETEETSPSSLSESNETDSANE